MSLITTTSINEPSHPPLSSDFRNLDVLRATAVTWVFGAHLILFLLKFGYIPIGRYKEEWILLFNQIGHLGVLFFFVHTALVLMLSLDRTPGTGTTLNFYIRRVFRIYPLSIACIVTVLVLRVPQIPDWSYSPWDRSEVIANLLLVQNIFRKPRIIMPLWTLPREFQMYLALPFIYMLLKRIPSTVVVLLLWFAFFAAVPSAPLLSSFPCFMGGVLAYQLAKERVFRLPSYGWPIAILGLSALNIVASLTIFPDYRADYLLCMLLGLIIPSFLELSESWITNVSRIVARYSYGIYLWHEPAVWLSFVKLKSFPIGVKWAVLVLLIVCVPLAAYHWLEAPLIRVGRNLATRWTAAYGRSRASRHGTFQEPSPQLAD